MTESAPAAPAQDAQATPPRSRKALMRRLADVVSLPSSRVHTFERSVTADLLVEMLRDAEPDERLRVSRRIAPLSEIPGSLVRLLLRDEIEIARILIEECAALTDADLAGCAIVCGPEHRRAIAARKGVSEVVSEAVVEPCEIEVLEALLKNPTARLSQPAVEATVAASRDHPALIPLLLRRPELRPSGAYVMFWWCDWTSRRAILQRFAVSRQVLQEAAEDVFPIAAGENWSDDLSRRALQFIERRQRNRAALEKSRFDSLEAAVAAAEEGLTRELADEIAFLAGIRPSTAAKILSDEGGEPLAVLCKATGLPKASLRQLWRALGRPEELDGNLVEGFERVLVVFDMIAHDRAQTVLRYWNWSLTSALTPALVRAVRDADDKAYDELNADPKTA